MLKLSPPKIALISVGVFLGSAVFGVPARPVKEKAEMSPFAGRLGEAKAKLIKDGGGNAASEAAVAKGLDWIVKHQNQDGSWSLDNFRCNCAGRGNHNNDIAGTAFGLLPLLGTGKTHKIGKDKKDPYRKSVQMGLNYLMRKQSKRTGDLGGGMYSHGLTTIALCEAYGMTKDPMLKRSAQAAVNFICRAQHEFGGVGGWRYSPGEAGDTSSTGWQVTALKSAQLAGLMVPRETLKLAEKFLDDCEDPNNGGYGYIGKGSTFNTTAIGLLCRQNLQGWTPKTPRLAKAVNRFLMKNLPGKTKNMYYYYYATQVMHHVGGDDWKKWNEKMRDGLIKTQDDGSVPKNDHQKGSWSPAGDMWGTVGGRLMSTSLSLLTVEVYYRSLPIGKAVEEKK